MSYWLEDADGEYLGDLATNVGIGQLRKASLGPLARFLDTGEADGDLLQAIQAEALAVPSVAYVADLLEGAKAPVYVTDGCGHEDEVENSKPTLTDQLSQILNHSQPGDDGRLSDDDLRRILYHKKERTAQ